MSDETPPYLRYEGLLMSGADAIQADADAQLRGNVFVVPTSERVGGEVVYARLDPDSVRPA